MDEHSRFDCKYHHNGSPLHNVRIVFKTPASLWSIRTMPPGADFGCWIGRLIVGKVYDLDIVHSGRLGKPITSP